MTSNIFTICGILIFTAAEYSYAQVPEGALAAKGQLVFAERCSLCHGASGKGDGRLSQLINKPSPANLTQSLLPPQQLRKVIFNGAAALGRPSKMPAWGDILDSEDFEAVLSYVLGLRSISSDGKSSNLP